ncbi:hypothetical protein HY643_04645 [Candidatus Woesearchaeota archaeon]|nr:hypothetical protein [Candidatus Woesearchaeota archaeon]
MKENKDSKGFVTQTIFTDIAKEIFAKYWNNPNFLTKNRKKINQYSKILDQAYSKCSNNYASTANLAALIPLSKNARHTFRQFNTLVWFTVHFNEEFCRSLLEYHKIGISADRLKEIWKNATTPAFDSFEKRRLKYILKLINEKTSWLSVAEKCQYFYANYDKIANLEKAKEELYKEYGRLTQNQVRDLIKKEKEEQKKRVLSHKKWFKSLDKKEQKLVNYLQEVIWLRDVRKDVVSKVLTITYRVAQRLFREVDLDERLIPYYSVDEVSRGLGYLTKNKENILKRPAGISMLLTMDSDAPPEFEYGTYELTRDKLEKYYKENLVKTEIKNLKEISGEVACQGKVRGHVRIVTNPSKTKNFKQGDILVTAMTRPEFVPLMKKAAAVITDEGGITSHAAIVSRELKVPCIIGTKFSSTILKDGDFVEVDANKGIVRILRRV